MKKNKIYNRIKLSISLIEYIIFFIYLLILSFTPLSTNIYNFITGFIQTENKYIIVLLYFIGCSLLISPLTIILDFTNGYLVEHHFKLSNQNIFQYIWENIKSLIVSTIIFTPLLLIFYFVLDKAGHNWWIIISIVLFFFSILMAKIAPILILPLFYKLSPLENNELIAKINSLIKNTKINLKGIYTINLSKNTKKANAAFTGFGKTKKILLGDTLLNKLNTDQIISVFAHELAHYEKKHILFQILSGTFITFAGMYIASIFHAKLIHFSGYSNITDIPSLPIITLILFLYSFITMPLSNSLSRKHEREADISACKKLNSNQVFIESLDILSESNLSDPDPFWLVEFMFYSHPSINKRKKFILENT